MNYEIDVATGEVKCGKNKTLLKSNAIGSCVVIVAYDCLSKIGGLAHVMLPGIAPLKNGIQVNKYASNAIDDLYNQLSYLGSQLFNIEVCLVGGANVLQREGDTIGEDNIHSVEKLLGGKNSVVKKKALGGVLRKTVCLNVEEGKVNYTEGDSNQQLLYVFT